MTLFLSIPAVYRWVSGLSHEQLARFATVFPILANDDRNIPSTTTKKTGMLLQASRSTMPEWGCFGTETVTSAREPVGIEASLRRATSSHLVYGAFEERQMREAIPVLTHTRRTEKSQINQPERSAEYMEKWSERQLNTTYRHDYCHCGFDRTVRDQNVDQTVVVYSKNTLNDNAAARAAHYVDRDPVWTRNFREMCRMLSDAITATDYREGFTEVKKAKGERFTHPRWGDPEYVSTGLEKPPEASWASTQRDYGPLRKTKETVPYDDQHRARYSKPFSVNSKIEKQTTTVRADFKDHIACRDDNLNIGRISSCGYPQGQHLLEIVLEMGRRRKHLVSLKY
jgi:hypothetical protein